MSLFPAYENKDVSNEVSEVPNEAFIDDNTRSSNQWLQNSSFKSEIITFSRILDISDSSEDSESGGNEKQIKIPAKINLADLEKIEREESSEKVHLKRIQSKKHHKGSRKKDKKSDKLNIKPSYELHVENVYYDDKFRDKGNFKVDTLCSRARPLYNLSDKTLGFVINKIDKEERERYYTKKFENKRKVKASNTKTKIFSKDDKKNEAQKALNELEEQMRQEREEIKKSQIKEFNEKLTLKPHDIDLWCEYINYQDRDNEFDNFSQSNPEEKLKYQRKLAIVEKALEKNPHSKRLLKIKLNFMSELISVDQYADEIESMISKDPTNIMLWQALITTIRSSLGVCTVPKVIKLYCKCFDTLHLWPRKCQLTYDNHLLNIVYHSLTFFRHAGLWEQMWEAIRLNLNLNLSTSITSNGSSHFFKGSIDEKILIEMEEVILTTQLPLNQLWLRVELLREHCHWITITRDELELVGDPHRFITPNDVTEFVHPLLNRESHFKMAVYALMALKIPLLPSRHQSMLDLGLTNDSNWMFDGLELLIPLLYPCSGEMAGYKQREKLSSGLLEGKLTSGPQYLRYHPQETHQLYLSFIRDIFHSIAESQQEEYKTSIYIWWLQFERMLLWFHKKPEHAVKIIDKSVKKLKGILKDFLKRPENRNNLLYYREYALIEREMGHLNSCINILEMSIGQKTNYLALTSDKTEQKVLLSLYRTLVQVLFDISSWDESTETRVLKVFSQMSDGQNDVERLCNTEHYLQCCYQTFIENPDSLLLESTLAGHFLPNYYCDAVMLYVYLLFIKGEELGNIFVMLEKCLKQSENYLALQEQFYESKIAFLQLLFERSTIKLRTLQECLNVSYDKYPDNFYMLSVLAGIQSELPHWSLCTQRESNRLWTNIALCLAGRARLHASSCLNDTTAVTAALNKLLHFHERLARLAETQCCPLLWRLYMLLIREQNLCEKKGEQTYHECVAYCPWARCIYVDAAEVAPQLLTEMQDVIREKNLRMHATPEELDILRG